MANISEEELRDEITNILKNASLDKTSTKKVIQKLEKKLGVDLSKKKKLIDQLVMDYVNSLESESEDEDDDEEEEVVVKKKKEDDEEEEEERDDSNDSDWGDELLNEFVPNRNHDYSPVHNVDQEATITTSQMGPIVPPRSTMPRKAVILKRVSPTKVEEDESDIFGKLTAKKLRRLPEEKRDSLMIQINKLIYEKSYKRSTPKETQANGRQPENSKRPRVIQPLLPIPGLAAHMQAKKIFRVKSLPGALASFVAYDPSTAGPPFPQATPAPPAPQGAAQLTPEDPGYVCNLM